MLKKMDLASKDFQEVSIKFGLNTSDREIMRTHYNNFRKQLINRHYTVLHNWLANEGSQYTATRVGPRLTPCEVKEMLKTNDHLHRIWEPIDILDDSHWLGQGDDWMKLLWGRTATFLSNAAALVKEDKKVSMEDAMKWYRFILKWNPLTLPRLGAFDNEAAAKTGLKRKLAQQHPIFFERTNISARPVIPPQDQLVIYTPVYWRGSYFQL